MLHALIAVALFAGNDSAPAPPPPTEPPGWRKLEAIYREACAPKAPHQDVSYPENLAGTNLSGTAVLILTLNPCGEVRDVVIEKSSQNRDVDRAAIESVRAWVIDPKLAQLSPGMGGQVRVPVAIMPSAQETP